MLFTLAHLLLTIGLLGFGAFFGAEIGQSIGAPQVGGVIYGLVLAGGLLALFGLSWPLYRLLHLRPLGLPFCPHCQKRHGNYHIPADAWPVCVLLCQSCGQPTRLCLKRTLSTKVSDDLPTLYLRRPEFLGIWSRAKLFTVSSNSIATPTNV